MKDSVVTRQSRIDAYSKMKGPGGAGRDEENLDYWSNRAHDNSKLAPRASYGPMKLPSTKVSTRDTAMRPYVQRDSRAVAKSDLNHEGDNSPFMKSVGRGQS